MGSGDAVGGESTDYKQGQQLLQQQGWHRAVEVGLKQTFLPAGYPASVQPTFFTYCQWQFLHMATGSAAGVLSMQALLYAAGLGAGAVPLAAAINWVLKDGLGQLGGVLYGAWFGTRFDSDPKRHRFTAVMALQVSMALEIVTAMVPHLFLPLASLANVGKNISWLASSATRAQMHLSLTKQTNIGDLTAKVTSQTIAASLVGTAMGIGASYLTGSEAGDILLAFLPLSAASVYANYRSSNAVHLDTLSVQRAEILFSDMLLQGKLPAEKWHIMSPAAVSDRERFVSPALQPFGNAALALEPLLRDTVKAVAADELRDSLERAGFCQDEQYALCIVPGGGGLVTVSLWFGDNATPLDMFAGLFHACTIRSRVLDDPSLAASATARATTVAHSHRFASQALKAVLPALEAAGWNLNVFPASQGRTLELPPAQAEV